MIVDAYYIQESAHVVSLLETGEEQAGGADSTDDGSKHCSRATSSSVGSVVRLSTHRPKTNIMGSKLSKLSPQKTPQLQALDNEFKAFYSLNSFKTPSPNPDLQEP